MSPETLSLSEARRIALAAQGFDRPRPRGRPGAGHVRRVIQQLGLVQIDFVNVLVPAHYQVLFSRLGPYDKKHLHDLVYRRREFTEQWAHEASIVPVATWPLLRFRMETHRIRPYGFEKYIAENPEYVASVLEEVRLRGPLTADDLPGPDWRIPGAWHGSVPRAVLEAHFGRGLLAVAHRRRNFARSYDLAERVLSAEHHGRQVQCADAQRELLRLAASACGIAAVTDLADYYRMSTREARPRIAELVETGELREVKVEGWRELGYLHRSARLPQHIGARALLSPFDPTIWFRPRALRLFNFDYRIEIFVPQPRRKWGYYVLPFLLDDCLVARVDLKADRKARRLAVLSAHLESHAKPRAVAEPLAAELHLLADWLGLDSVDVVRQGAFARSLAAAVVKMKNDDRR
jgi:uncharacterized protein